MPFVASIVLPTGQARSGVYSTRDLDADGFSDDVAFVQPSLVSLPSARFIIGDSQASGAAPGVLTHSSPSAFESLRAELFTETANYTVLALGGRALQGHIEALQAAWGISGSPRVGPDWVHIMETGNQNEIGQHTPTEFGETVTAGLTWIYSRSPNAIVSWEIPTSFGRIDEVDRDWRAHAEELRRRIALFAAQGKTIHVIETDSRIRALEKKLTPAVVWYQPGDPQQRQYHFTDVGNVMVAMTMLWHLGCDVNNLTFADILAEGIVTQQQINACLDVLNGV